MNEKKILQSFLDSTRAAAYKAGRDRVTITYRLLDPGHGLCNETKIITPSALVIIRK